MISEYIAARLELVRHSAAPARDQSRNWNLIENALKSRIRSATWAWRWFDASCTAVQLPLTLTTLPWQRRGLPSAEFDLHSCYAQPTL